MGSSGSGSLTDYSKRKPSGALKNGGGSGEDNCGKGFSTSLEEVSRCFYFINYADVPPVGTIVSIFFNGLRLSVENFKGEEIGYLPTKFNYIKNCMADGFSYTGVIIAANLIPFPSITADVIPEP